MAVMPTSRAVLVLGMHRSGTSAIARGLASLSVDLGNDFLDAQPENPTGYWEDRGIVEINERLLKLLGLTWDDATPIDRRAFGRLRVRWLRREAVRTLRRSFGSAPLWGFKDPRTIRLLPFWRDALQTVRAGDAYVVAIRNPLSVAASLHARQKMDAQDSHRLWLAHMVPFLHELRDRPMVVVDYDRVMANPASELARIARGLDLESKGNDEIPQFASEFLDSRLRHSVYTADDFEARTEVDRLTKEAYEQLAGLAADQGSPADPAFWEAWRDLQGRLQALRGKA